jgi:hypothetical protein
MVCFWVALGFGITLRGEIIHQRRAISWILPRNVEKFIFFLYDE